MQTKEIKLGGMTLSSNVLMAPLVGYTCYPFRMLCYEMGAGLCYTEMVSCNALKYQDVATERLLFTTIDEKPKAAQLLGSDPRIMEKMARSEYLSGFDIIDINMGCPVPNVVKSGEGSALLTDLKRASAMIRGVKKSGKIITVKCRVGMREDALIAAEIAKMCEDSGADLITVHGRSRYMMYEGVPHYDQIEQAKSAVKIPVIANGGIFSASEAEKMMNMTGVDGVMIARYGLENPFIFRELTGRSNKKSRYVVLLEQIKLTQTHFDENFTLAYIKRIASYFMKKSTKPKRYKTELQACGNLAALKEMVEKIFGEE